MSKYSEFYYCGLCGSELSIPDIEFDDDIVGFDVAKGRIIVKKMKPIKHTFYKMHECADGSVGVLSFLGFKKLADDEGTEVIDENNGGEVLGELPEVE